MSNLRSFWLLVVCVFLAISSAAQTKATFGKVSLAELQMKSYDRDTTAAAVILSDVGSLNSFSFEFSRHIRVKILSKSGLDWGNWVFRTPSKSDFDVQVFNLVNGQVVKEKVEDGSIYKEEIVDGYDVYKVFAPHVTVGSVIDVSYKHLGIPYEWRFQERIPVVYSEISIPNSPYYSFSKTFYGFESIKAVSPDEWQATNMPAFKVEPHLNHFSNYLTKFEFQLETITYRGNIVFEISTTWRKVIERLQRLPRFGETLSGAAFLNDFAKETKQKNLTTEQKIDAAYQYIKQNIKWNGHKTIFCSSGLRNQFVNEHTGNSADINLLLVALLNRIDIEAYPVVLSTRENGLIVQHSPSINKLNYVVAFVRHGGLEVLLDAAWEEGIPGILPTFCLNGHGLLVKKDNEQWIPLNKTHKEIKRQYVEMDITPDKAATAKVTQEWKGYGYVNWSDSFRAHNRDTAIHRYDLETKNPDLDFLSYAIRKNDAGKLTSSEVIGVNCTSQVVDVGDGFILNPFILFDYTNNIFKSDSRKYPLDLQCPKEYVTTIIVKHPSGFVPRSLPESLKLSSPDGSATFTYFATAANGGLQFKAILNLNRYIYTETEYAELRQFFSEVARKVSTPVEMIKLKS
jgi:hypothetical protein